jgi:hypothetical protein
VSLGSARAFSPVSARGLRSAVDSDTDETASDVDAEDTDDAPLATLVRCAVHLPCGTRRSSSTAPRSHRHRRPPRASSTTSSGRSPSASRTSRSVSRGSRRASAPPRPMPRLRLPCLDARRPWYRPDAAHAQAGPDFPAHPPACTFSLSGAALMLPARGYGAAADAGEVARGAPRRSRAQRARRRGGGERVACAARVYPYRTRADGLGLPRGQPAALAPERRRRRARAGSAATAARAPATQGCAANVEARPPGRDPRPWRARWFASRRATSRTHCPCSHEYDLHFTLI